MSFDHIGREVLRWVRATLETTSGQNLLQQDGGDVSSGTKKYFNNLFQNNSFFKQHIFFFQIPKGQVIFSVQNLFGGTSIPSR